VVLYQL